MCRKLCNPWHSFLRLPHVPFVWGIRKFNPTAPQLPKIEAIQTSLFVDVPDVLVTVFIRNASTSESKSISMFLRYLARLTVGPGFGTNLLTRPEYSVSTFWSGPNTRFQHSDPAWYRSRIDTRFGFPTRLAKESKMTSRGLNIEIFPVFRLCITFLHYLFALPFW